MKRIIKNKQYDTETAKRLGAYEPNPYGSDLSWFCETLYQKRTGEFFLHGDGNAASRYSKSCGQNSWCGDERIIPLTFSEAQKWAEEHLDGDDYIAIFGEPEEDDKMQMSLWISEKAAAKIRQGAAAAGSSISEYVEKMVKNWGDKP